MTRSNGKGASCSKVMMATFFRPNLVTFIRHNLALLSCWWTLFKQQDGEGGCNKMWWEVTPTVDNLHESASMFGIAQVST